MIKSYTEQDYKTFKEDGLAKVLFEWLKENAAIEKETAYNMYSSCSINKASLPMIERSQMAYVVINKILESSLEDIKTFFENVGGTDAK